LLDDGFSLCVGQVFVVQCGTGETVNNNTNGIAAARQAHSTRCRQRLRAALEQAVHLGTEISISAIARRAGVDRSFLSRHRDLHAVVLVKAAEPTTTRTGGPSVSRPSLIADLANAHDRRRRAGRDTGHQPRAHDPAQPATPRRV
jgi:hypothetical protein